MWKMRRWIARFLLAAAAVCLIAPSADARNAAQRDVESYAIASCLANQDQPYLKDQGDAWASVILQRAKGGLDAFASVAATVRTELAKGNMSVIRSETGSAKDKPLPLQYCGEIVDVPSVHVAIDKAVKKMESSYRR